MKKLVSSVLAASMALSLAACGSSASTDTASSSHGDSAFYANSRGSTSPIPQKARSVLCRIFPQALLLLPL